METELVAIGSIHLDPANVRRHPERNLAAIKAALARFGQQKPIVVDANGIVRAGNGTLAAARELGWREIQIVRTSLSGAEATAYAIADNRTAELAEWDDAELQTMLKSLQEGKIPLEAVGFTPEEIDQLADCFEPESENEAWPAVVPPETRTIVLRYSNTDAVHLLKFLDATDPAFLTQGRAGVKILERIRQIAATPTN